MQYLLKDAVDLTQNLANGMPVYPGDPSPSFESYATLETNGVNLTRLILGSHTGTNTDAPKHFIRGGIGIDQVPLSKLIGEARVIDLSQKPIGSGITASDLKPRLEGILEDGEMVVFYTGCSDRWGDEAVNRNYTYLTQDAAEYLVSRKVSAVGIDFLSVEKFGAKDPVAHRVLLGSGVVIIESLSSALKRFVGKKVLLICLPIKLQGGDGAPSRVVAVPIAE
jgi:arylformamidase